jgi:hypothetical protein
LSGATRKIVPFVSGLKEDSQERFCFSREVDIPSRVEAILELTLIAAGVAGVVAGVMTM